MICGDRARRGIPNWTSRTCECVCVCECVRVRACEYVCVPFMFCEFPFTNNTHTRPFRYPCHVRWHCLCQGRNVGLTGGPLRISVVSHYKLENSAWRILHNIIYIADSPSPTDSEIHSTGGPTWSRGLRIVKSPQLSFSSNKIMEQNKTTSLVYR